MVKYQVQFKPINPVNKQPATNRDKSTVFTWQSTAANWDKVLFYVASNKQDSYLRAGDFTQVPHDIWAVYSVERSIKSAKTTAKELVRLYGKDNVQICKVVDADIEVVFKDND